MYRTWQLNPLPVTQNGPLAEEVALLFVEDELARGVIFDAHTTGLYVMEPKETKPAVLNVISVSKIRETIQV